MARGLQRLVYETAGQEFFTYFVLSVIILVLIALLFIFIFRLKIRNISQYLWLFCCAGLFIYLTSQLREHPEEAIHILEYGLLSYFVFKALNQRVHDWTVFLSAGLCVLLIGMLDEFFQWIIPKRYWGFNDVGLNGLAGGIFILAIWKGIRPQTADKPVEPHSVNVLVGMFTVTLIFLGLCLSNTPGAVQQYSSMFRGLSWLQDEEPMNEFGYRHDDRDMGIFYSRFTLNELEDIDSNRGLSYGQLIARQKSQDISYKELIEIYTPNTNPFLYEFLVHLLRRDSKVEEMNETDSIDEQIEKGSIAFSENMILKKYFNNTLKHSGFRWARGKEAELQQAFALQQVPHISTAGRIVITSFTLKQGWTAIFLILVFVWTGGRLWVRNITS